MESVGPEPFLIAALLGGVVGGLSGLVPGLHANTIAALGLVLALEGLAPSGATGAFLLAALGAWTFTTAVPLVVLGVPEGESAPALLPGQRMARQGRARQALQASATGSLVGLVLGAASGLALAHVLTLHDATGMLTAATPWVAGGALVVLVLTDPAGPLRALALAGLAGWLGAAALSLQLTSPLGLPATPLMPLFIGLFGLPALLGAARAAPPREPIPRPDGLPIRPRPGAERIHPVGPALGSTLGLAAGTFSGFTAGPATAVATLVRRGSDAELLATTSAVNTSAACVATAMLHAASRTRTGVHAAHLALAPPTPGLDQLAVLLGQLATGGVAGLLLLALATARAPALAATVPRLARWLIAPWLGLIVLFTGWPGLVVTAAAWSVAHLAPPLGARRSLLMASLLVPAVVRGLIG